ncbi:hypothetical protein QL919_10710 [Psychrobacter sp. APC 3426]|uniref:hypothetical protein n=1 Tax=Psychrobacter sp. APC 3426 TaxID=3035177 RepID=UPI0025B433C2|nr:hypothetical protein [Psychrobacter sp. APC 3426]MDN3399195.1 hypothetical protein [Psychrobacter sp. APC 3426]
MKSFKLALLTIATALVLQGCNDDNSDFNPPPTSSDIDTNIVGFWSEDDANGNLSAISFMDDGTYVQVQVNNNSSVDDPEGGLEWGEYSIDKKTGKLTTTQRFDENGDMGLSDAPNLSAHVSNGKLILQVDENENGSIDSDEQYKFSEIQPDGIVGAWSFDDVDDTDDELIGVAFLDDSQYVHVQVNSDLSVDNDENGLEWGTYAINPSTNQLTTTQTFDSNADKGLSEPSTRYARVTDDEKLILDVDDDSFTFSRTAVTEPVDAQMLSGLWRMDLGNEELVTLSFLDDGTYLQTQVTGPTSSRGSDNGIEWGEYSLKANNELEIDDVIFDNNGSAGLSDEVLRTVQITDDILTLGVDEDDSGIVDNDEKYQFTKAKSQNELGIWKAKAGQVDDELTLVGFLDDQTFFHIEVDEKPPFDEPEMPPSGMDWNLYTLGNNGLFTLGQSLYSNTGGNDLSFFYQMNISVSGDTLTFNGYEDQIEVQNNDGETVIFDRQ